MFKSLTPKNCSGRRTVSENCECCNFLFRRLVEELSVEDGELVRNVLEDGPYGGSGGSPWTDGGEVHLNGHPSAVDVRTGDRVDALRMK